MYDYNTTRSLLLLKEYGRHIQKLIEQLGKIDHKTVRTQNAHAIIRLMEIINPHAESIQKRWEDLFILSAYQLDIEGSHFQPVQRTSDRQVKAEIPLHIEPIKYKYYGRHVTTLLQRIATIDSPKVQEAMLITVGKLMRRFSSVWNNEYISNEKLIADIKAILPKNIEINLDPIWTLPEDVINSQKVKTNYYSKSNTYAPSKYKMLK